MRIDFVVHGVPAPQGSMRAFVVKGRPVMTSANKRTMPWRQEVAAAAHREMLGDSPSADALSVIVRFFFSRPKAHRTPKGELRKTAPVSMTTKPDIDKLVRAVLDAMTGVVFHDDAQINSLIVTKSYEEGFQGAQITVESRT